MNSSAPCTADGAGPRCFLAPLEDAAAEGEIHIEGDEDVETLKIKRSPKLPTADEVEGHECTHIPYRSWCKWCVMGRGRGEPHHQGQDSAVPVIGLDYFF